MSTLTSNPKRYDYSVEDGTYREVSDGTMVRFKDIERLLRPITEREPPHCPSCDCGSSETEAVEYVQFGWVPFHEKQGCDPASFVEHEEDCTEIIEGWRWVPAYAAIQPTSEKANSCVCGEPNSPGTHRTDGPCLALIGDRR